MKIYATKEHKFRTRQQQKKQTNKREIRKKHKVYGLHYIIAYE